MGEFADDEASVDGSGGSSDEHEGGGAAVGLFATFKEARKHDGRRLGIREQRVAAFELDALRARAEAEANVAEAEACSRRGALVTAPSLTRRIINTRACSHHSLLPMKNCMLK